MSRLRGRRPAPWLHELRALNDLDLAPGATMLRTFQDPEGREWQVWEVPAPDPRLTRSGRFLAPELQRGWLRFESADERRRLADYPRDWESLPDRALVELWSRASIVSDTPGRGRRRFSGSPEQTQSEQRPGGGA